MNTKSAVASVKRPNIVAVGTIVWLGSEVMFFAGLFAIYFTLRAMNPDLWAMQVEKHNFTFALINTLVLVASSFTAQAGVFAAERMQPRATGRGMGKWGTVEWFYLTFFMGAIFVSGQAYEYATFVSEGITLSGDPYGSAFYMTTGFHGIHVAVGLVAFLLVIGRIYSVKNFTHKEETTAVVVSYYWHFVDIVWIILFIVIYVLPLVQGY
ncbi:heme-copper oxidase subunit III [Leucobacter insecticola]|uniref:cytochrome-c oxidase n=1 Tax=Leucobacter insecticola TaxID=2714934 RepID=A0A6G8FM47_9MICO|nr:heme-copper oxidase subunit III [Leucobacter insecticola]QIM17404.1 heme-copper oxidase subunit III [Leucobacter insecticola]